MHVPTRSPAALVTVVTLALGALACGDARSLATAGVVGACTRCHGGDEDATGAPPRDTSGRSDPSLPSVGAHAAHLAPGALSGGFGCDACHVTPGAVESPGHLDGEVGITFGALATAGGALAPSYDARAFGCASVYCHGAFRGGNAANVPLWTGGSGEAACGTCHGGASAIPTSLPSVHARLAPDSTNATCNVCHAETVRADGTVSAGTHVNGAVETDPGAVHPAGWLVPASGTFHGAAAAAGQDACFRCHAADVPAQVTTVVCNGCHAKLGSPIAP